MTARSEAEPARGASLLLLAAIFALRPGHDGSAESLALLLAAGWAVAAGVCSSLRVRQGPV